MGAWQAWYGRHHMSADGISYLDVADAYLRGDWKTAVNAYWSPLYSWLLGLALLVLKPSPYYEFAVFHLVNFVIYLLTIVSFNFFLLQLIDYHRYKQVNIPENRCITFPEWAWIALGYSIFFQSSLDMIGVWEESPDMLVAAIVYLASGIILRIRNGKTSTGTYALLGATLGVGYLSKAVMFPMAFIFLSLSAFSMGNLRKALTRTILSLFIFLIVASPLIAALSKSKGRITFGDAGTYSYWFHVNGYNDYHWDGDPPGSGIPKHPPRKIYDKPAIYEFSTPFDVTYPLWYDPSYWNDGLKVHFDLKEQLQAIKRNVKMYYPLFYPRYSVLIFGSLILYLMSRRRRMVLMDIADHWNLFIPAIAGLSMYALVNLDDRYVGPFIDLMWLGVLSGICLPDSEDSKRLLKYVAILMAFVMMVVTTLHVMPPESPPTHVQWQAADALNQMGIKSGDKVASIGNSHSHFWARLAKVRIVAEIPQESAAEFWTADAPTKSKVFKTFRKTGAIAVVTSLVPYNTSLSGWQRLADTDYYVHMLN